MVARLAVDNAGLTLDMFHTETEHGTIEGGLRTVGNRLWRLQITDSNRRYRVSGHPDFGSILCARREVGPTAMSLAI